MDSDSSCQTMICMICGEVFETDFVTYLCPPCHGKLAESLKKINSSHTTKTPEEKK